MSKQRYAVNVTFETDRVLSNEELAHLEHAVLVQIEDPSSHDWDEKRAAFTTRIIQTGAFITKEVQQ